MIKKQFLSHFMLALSLTSLISCSAHEINAGIGIASNLFQGATITNDKLAQKASLSANVMDRRNQLAAPNNSYAKRLNRLTQNLQNYDGMNLNFKVYLSDTINAFAMPDGTVRVYSGLMDLMSDDELLAVIGHEMGHVKRRHSLQQYRKAYLAKAAAAGLVAYGGDTVSSAASAYGNIGLAAINAQFSQKDELESDAYGVEFLHKIGRNPYAAASAQKKLMSKGGGQGGFFASHPSSKERIQKATEVAKAIAKN